MHLARSVHCVNWIVAFDKETCSPACRYGQACIVSIPQLYCQIQTKQLPVDRTGSQRRLKRTMKAEQMAMKDSKRLSCLTFRIWSFVEAEGRWQSRETITEQGDDKRVSNYIKLNETWPGNGISELSANSICKCWQHKARTLLSDRLGLYLTLRRQNVWHCFQSVSLVATTRWLWKISEAIAGTVWRVNWIPCSRFSPDR